MSVRKIFRVILQFHPADRYCPPILGSRHFHGFPGPFNSAKHLERKREEALSWTDKTQKLIWGTQRTRVSLPLQYRTRWLGATKRNHEKYGHKLWFACGEAGTHKRPRIGPSVWLNEI
jgi:hypothetical protein